MTDTADGHENPKDKGARASRAPAIPFDAKAAHGLRSFDKANTAALHHGAFSRYVIPEADELAALIVECAPHLGAPDGPALRDYCISQVRAWRLAAFIEASGELDAEGRPLPALGMLGTWLARAEKARGRLGLDPMSRAALAVDELGARRQAAALGRDELAHGRRLREQADARDAGGDDDAA